MSRDHTYIVPPQTEGSKKDIEEKVAAVDENDARKLFAMARERLMSVNAWHTFSGPAHFQLTDRRGVAVERTAERGDYFKINIHVPGPVKGDGYDWVYIEEIEERSDPDGHDEYIAMRVRPTSNPTKDAGDVAHFFSAESTSSFIVSRSYQDVSAAVYGRNEKPNTETDNIVDKVRNTVVATTAILGLSNVEWGSLVKGLLHI